MATLKVTNIKNESFAGDQLYLKTDGKIGIGTTAPSQLLHVKATGANSLLFVERDSGALAFLEAQAAKVTLGSSNNHPVHIVQNSGDALMIDSSKRVGIGNISPSFLLDIKATTSEDVLRLCNSSESGHGSHDTKIVAGGSYYQNPTLVGSVIKFKTYNGSAEGERIRIDKDGRLLMGSAANSHNGGDLIQLSATSSTASIQLNRYTANQHPSYINFFKSRNASISGQTVVQDGDTLGLLAFYGSDGTDRALGAEVCAQVDGTPGSDDMPGRLVFRTSTDGSQSPTEKLRITSGDLASFGNSSPNAWQTGGEYYNIQLGNAGYLRADTDAGGNFFSYGVNLYRDNSGWKFIENGRGTQISHGIGNTAITFYGTNSGNAGGTPSFFEMLRLDVDGDVVCGSGNLVLTDGQGISFAADGNAGGMTSELLDDYEEGTWTPTMATSNGNLTATYTTQTGTYTKIGRLVYVVFDMQVSNTPTGTAGHPQIRGLPFTPTVGQATQGGYPIPQFRDSSAMPVDARLYNSSYGHSSNTAIWIQYYNSSGTIQQPNNTTWWAQGRCQGELVYYAT